MKEAERSMRGYTINDLHAVIYDNRWAVRDEAERRHGLASARMIKVRAELAELEALIKAAREGVE